nr:subtilisin-like protease SBT4.3 [Tanacetum cinerariifolium]
GQGVNAFPSSYRESPLVRGKEVTSMCSETDARVLKVQILKSEAVHNSDARLVATFSSRGPSKFVPNIIKPDVTAPGVEVLAAFSPKAAPSEYLIENRSVEYNILSGTSMVCPHVTASAVYVKSFHLSWSPSAIKSALMTTAWKFFDGLDPEAEFAYGSGHINALMATDPGLVLNATSGGEKAVTPRLTITEDETIDIFTKKLTTLVNKAASLGHTMEDETLVRKLLNAVPDGYQQIVASIEQYSDLSIMTMEEAIGRLKTYEEKLKSAEIAENAEDSMECKKFQKLINVIKALDEFSSVSELVPSLRKCSTFFGNVKAKVKAAIYRVMPFGVGTLPVRYLADVVEYGEWKRPAI